MIKYYCDKCNIEAEKNFLHCALGLDNDYMLCDKCYEEFNKLTIKLQMNYNKEIKKFIGENNEKE